MTTTEGEQPGLFAGRFRILREVGSGGMGKVYLAEDTLLGGDPIALKLLRSDIAEDEEQRQRFLREAQIARKLSDPRIVRTYELALEGTTPFITMEFIDGESLRDRIKRTPLNVGEAMRILVETSRALAVIHGAGVFHRDLKPGNILLDKDGRIHIADFGVARVSSSTLTSPDVVIGSSAYLAPELWKGQPASAASDLYALGIIGFEMVMGNVPYDGASPVEVMAKHMTGEFPQPHQRRPDIPAWYSSILRRLLATTPDGRPASSTEAILFMQDIMSHGMAQAAAESLPRASRAVVPPPLVDGPRRPRSNSSTSLGRQFSGEFMVDTIASPDARARHRRKSSEDLRRDLRRLDPLSPEAVVGLALPYSCLHELKRRLSTFICAALVFAIAVVLTHDFLTAFVRPALSTASGWFGYFLLAFSAFVYMAVGACAWMALSWGYRRAYMGRWKFLLNLLWGFAAAFVVLVTYDLVTVVSRADGHFEVLSGYRVRNVAEQNLEKLVRLAFLVPRARDSALGAPALRDEMARPLGAPSRSVAGRRSKTNALSPTFSDSTPTLQAFGVPLAYLAVYLVMTLFAGFAFLRYIVGTVTAEAVRLAPAIIIVTFAIPLIELGVAEMFMQSSGWLGSAMVLNLGVSTIYTYGFECAYAALNWGLLVVLCCVVGPFLAESHR